MFNNFTETELAQEQWRDVDGYDGAYQVSDLGRVRSKKYGDWRAMKGGKDKFGYANVRLYRNRKGKTVKVHRLVAQAFIPNSDNSKTQINHINEIKTDNRASNLEWCTVSYNNTYNGLRFRQPHPQPKRSKIKGIYDPDLSYKQNIELFRANGIECSKNTLTRLRKDLGLIN